MMLWLHGVPAPTVVPFVAQLIDFIFAFGLVLCIATLAVYGLARAHGGQW